MSRYFKGGGENGRDAAWKAWWGVERGETEGGKQMKDKSRASEVTVWWRSWDKRGPGEILFSNDSLCWQPYSWLELQMFQIAKQDRPSDIRNVKPQFSTIFLWLATVFEASWCSKEHPSSSPNRVRTRLGLLYLDPDLVQREMRQSEESVGKEVDITYCISETLTCLV